MGSGLGCLACSPTSIGGANQAGGGAGLCPRRAGRRPAAGARIPDWHTKFGAKDCGGGLCVSKGRCTSLKRRHFGLEEENAVAAAMERGRSGQRFLRLAQLVFAKREERTRGHRPTGTRTGDQVALASCAQSTRRGRTTACGQRLAAGQRPRSWARRTTPWVVRRLHGACGSLTGRTRHPYTRASRWRRVATRPGAVPRSGVRGYECWRKAPVFISFGPFQNR
jgi:hypothetical protein